MTLIVRPGFQFDTDASTYIEAVEVADTQALETATRYAINDFVIGCKQDGTWSAIKASCILSGARTLAGALIPLAGTAPTNNNFVSGDYNRKTGLIGNGSSKYLNSNRNNNADPQNNQHLAAYRSLVVVGGGTDIGAGVLQVGTTGVGTGAANTLVPRSRTNTVPVKAGTTTLGLVGMSRDSSSAFTARHSRETATFSVTSQAPYSANIFVFGRNNDGVLDDAIVSTTRLAFYSIGESLNLALLDARVTALITAFGVAIP
jgi:hypothetical protein